MSKLWLGTRIYTVRNLIDSGKINLNMCSLKNNQGSFFIMFMCVGVRGVMCSGLTAGNTGAPGAPEVGTGRECRSFARAACARKL